MYLGYCFTNDGWHTPAVNLKTPEEAVSYARLQGKLFPEVRITDEFDCIVLHVVNGKIVFPEGFENKEGF